MARADHRPNWVWVRCKAAPMAGKASRATELNTKTVPSETAISSSEALEMGPTAAMALPPQIAVPAEIRKPEMRPTPKILPSRTPMSMTEVMLMAV